MSYLVDTNCISELVKKRPNSKVVRWFNTHEETNLYLSVITFGELEKGIAKLSDSEQKEQLRSWVNQDLYYRFEDRIINVTRREVSEWGRLLAESENRGRPVPAVDALIAATALVHDLTVVTRNVEDMQPNGVDWVNPWEGED